MTAPVRAIGACRACGNENLVPLLDLGEQHLTGVFPREPHAAITRGPLALVKCHEPGDGEACGLVQLHHSYAQTELYGEEYGYRSSLNSSMVRHLGEIVGRIGETVRLSAGDIVLDIGSNDGTLLRAYPSRGLTLVGIDPLSARFGATYPAESVRIAAFFSGHVFRRHFGSRKAKVITAVAMLYDLEDPLGTMRELAEVLADDGVCVLEQSYLPAMLSRNAYDTICHEHLEYYAMRQIAWLSRRAGLKIVDVERNDVNGGSFAVTLAHARAPGRVASEAVAELVAEERAAGIEGLACYEGFSRRVERHRDVLRERLDGIRRAGRKILGYGASTKGNVLLQYCGITPHDVPYIAEVNGDKFGRVTPGTWIPIISEAEAHAMAPDVFLVLPWHFRENLMAREAAFLAAGKTMLFPLPVVEEV